jgi:phage terminase large subunit
MNLEFDASPVYERIWNNAKRINVLRGGSGSTKTYSMCQVYATWLMTGHMTAQYYIPRGIASIVREFRATLKKSVLRDFKNVLDTTCLEDGTPIRNMVKENKTDFTYTYTDPAGNTRVVELFGADDEQKLRGPRRDSLYCNEANELGFLTQFHQMNMRTRQVTFVDFNPDDEESWMNIEIEQKRAQERGDVYVDLSTYLDNPFLSDQEVEEIEYLQKVDPMLWKIYGLGEYGRMEGLVFPQVEIIPEVPEEAKFLTRGLDWGFTNDPTALIDLHQWNGGVIYDERLYEHGLTNPDIDRKMRELGIAQHQTIWGDSSEPKSIEELNRLGWSVAASEKGPDSINFGIMVMKQQPIYVTATSRNLLREMRKYIWKKDKNGASLNVPIDEFNHGIDAGRYGAMMTLGKNIREQYHRHGVAKNKPISAGIRQKSF